MSNDQIKPGIDPSKVTLQNLTTIVNQPLCGMTVQGMLKRFKNKDINSEEISSVIKIYFTPKEGGDDQSSAEIMIKVWNNTTFVGGKPTNEGSTEVKLPFKGMDALIAHMDKNGCAIQEVWNKGMFHTMVALK